MLRAWAQLLRIPNVFTAPADVIAGALLALGGWPAGEQVPQLVQLCLASACLYLAGMVLNDVCDVDEDRRDRPQRPIPSGRIGFRTAVKVGVLLLCIGVGLGVTVPRPGAPDFAWVIPIVLALAIVLYDRWGKRTVLGPWIMGTCRGLNVMLGVLVASTWSTSTIWAAITVSLYITGVTYFARSEAKESERRTLWIGVWLMGAAFVSLVMLTLQLRGYPDPGIFNSLLLALIWGFVLSRFLARAIEVPGPAQVQAAVKACIFGLVALEAIHASLVVGLSGLSLLLFLPPALLLGRWVYST
jgi:4-hydroxybenzoate polyprenyltransferase